MQRVKWLLASLTIPAIALLGGCGTDQSPVAPQDADGAQGAPGFGAEPVALGAPGPGAVYTMSNAAAGNEIVAFQRAADGTLTPGPTFPTGGLGTGAGLGNQGGLRLATHRGRGVLLACNAGSNDISALVMGGSGAEVVDRVASGGEMPISVTMHGNLVYVLNAGGDGNISGLRFEGGRLHPLAGSTKPLSGAGVGPAQIEFSPNGHVLVVTEKGTNQIVTYVVGSDGRPGDPNPHASSGQTPFGFSFDRSGRHVVVSEAFGGNPGQSAVSSYRVFPDGTLQTVVSSLPNNQTAACWIHFARGGRYAYTTNTGTGNLTGYRENPESGELRMLDEDGVTGETGMGSTPIDIATDSSGRFLYVLAAGTQEIVGFQVAPDGSLAPVNTVGGLPMGVNGLAAR